MKAADVPVTIFKSAARSKVLRNQFEIWKNSKQPHYSPSGMTAKYFGLKCEEIGLLYDIEFVLDGEGGAYYTITLLDKGQCQS